MSARSFAVFQDTPTELSPSHRDNDDFAVNATASEAAATLLSTLAAIEKENLHPITGERAGPTSSSENKKRKTAALSTKLLVVPSSKKHKELKPDSKRLRKPPSSGEKLKSSDGRKRANSAKGSRMSRKTTSLPPVDEELESQREPARLLTSQATIDSRCYELTVSPLADVSEAYDTHSRGESQEPDTQSDQSGEPELRDSFSPSPVENPLPPTEAHRSDDTLTCQCNDISTPERKRTYSEFTFSSPSPSSGRFREAQSSPIRGDVAATTL